MATLATVVVSGCAGGASPPAPPPSVPCGVSTLGTVSVRRFCGTGRVTLHAGSLVTTVAAADCSTAQGAEAVDAGVLVLGDPSGPARGFAYVGVAVKGQLPPAPGATGTPLHRGLISADVRGRVISVTDAIVSLAPDGRGGTAQGRGRDGSAVEATFSC